MNAVMDLTYAERGSPGRVQLAPAIAAAFEDIASLRLICICAPAGFGKSTVLHALAARRRAWGDRVAWLPLNEADSDLPRFLRRLHDALKAAGHPGCRHSLRQLEQGLLGSPQALADGLLAEFGTPARPLLLVLDDFQQLRSSELPAFLQRLLRLAPRGLCVALGSSQAPSLALGRLRVEGRVLEIGSAQLRLSREDCQGYLEHAGLQLSEAQLAELHARTEGWPMGVQLAAHWLRGHAGETLPPLSDEPDTGDYLMQRVFESLPDELQEQLLALSIAEQVNAALASTLTGVVDGARLLERLEAQQLFLEPCDASRRWFRFHPLFAHFLRHRLELREPVRFRQLHFNASLWYANHHLQLPAIEHAALADDPHMLAALVDGCTLELVNQGQLQLIHAWREHIPDAIAAEYPMLVLADAWLQAAGRPLDQAYRILEALEQRSLASGERAPALLAIQAVKSMVALQKDDLPTCLALASAVCGRPGQYPAFLEVALLVSAALAHAVLAQPNEACALIAQAHQRTHLLRGDYLSMQLANLSVLMDLEQGRPGQARARLERMDSHWMERFEPDSDARALPSISAALVDYQQGRHEGLAERLRLALRHADLINPLDLQARALLALIRLLRIHEQGREARSSLALLKGLAQRNGSARLQALAQAEEVALLLHDNDAEALRRAEQAMLGADWEVLAADYADRAFNPVSFSRALARIRLLLAQARCGEALRELEALQATLDERWHGLQRLRLRLLCAAAQQGMGYRERALAVLQGCLVEAEREGLRSPFLEEGAAIRELLESLQNSQREPGLQAFVQSLLALWPASRPARCERLTEREQCILGLAADGLGNERIGERLGLALGTVKWHMHNIYDKLGVRNRSQAIRRLREQDVRP